MEIAKGVEDVALQKGYTTFMCNVEKNSRIESEYIEQLLTRKVDGIILMFSFLQEENLKAVQEDGVPIVLIGENKDIKGFNSVRVDCKAGAEGMIRNFIEYGHKTIGILYGSDPEQESRDMLEGYREVLEENGIAIEEKYIKAVDNTIEGGYLGAKKNGGGDGPPQAIFATSDEIAYGAMDAIKDLGMKVPDDVAVAGFGNARDVKPRGAEKLTTVELPTRSTRWGSTVPDCCLT